MKYRPEIDGLRAIAVVAVILFHAGFKQFSGGYVGVDVFFVISGFLITKIILSEIIKGKFSIVNFYERRARRIMPLIFVLLFVTSIAAWFILYPSEMKLYSDSVIAVSGFYSNILFFLESSYWDLSSELKPLLHTWSLAVEEQFYLLFPIFLLIINKFKIQWTLPLLIIGCIATLLFSQWASVHYPSANFYLLPSRMWELGMGAIIATLSVNHEKLYNQLISNKLVNEVLNIIGLGSILLSIFIFSEHTPFPSFYALLPIVGTGLIIMFGNEKTIVGKILSSKPMVTIGLISYSAYLWHQPLFAFVKYVSFPHPSLWLMGLLSILVIPISYITWKYVENPFRNKAKYSRKKIFTYTLIGTLLFISFGLGGHFTNGFPKRSLVQRLNIKNYNVDNAKLQKDSWGILKKKANNDEYFLIENAYDNTLWFDISNKKCKLLIVGNSHSKDVYNTLISSQTANTEFQLARYGIQINSLADENNKFYNSPNFKASDIIMIATRYTAEDLEKLDSIFSNIIRYNKKVVVLKNIHEFEIFGTKTFADLFIQKEIYTNDNLEQNPNDINQLVENINHNYYLEYKKGNKRVTAVNDQIATSLNDYPDILILDRMDYICSQEDGTCNMISDSLDKFFYDYGHNTLSGAAYYGKKIDSINWLEPIVGCY